MVKYLIDTSAAVKATRNPGVAQRLTTIGRDDRYICTPVLIELGYSARNATDHGYRIGRLVAGSHRLFFTPTVEQRAIEVQGLLAARGQHRSAKLADLLIAALAEAKGLTVLHYDHDYDLIAGVTGQSMEWVVPKGSVS